MKKIFVLGLLVVLMVFSLASCAGNGDTTATPTPPGADDNRPVFAYATMSMSNQWMQNIHRALVTMGEQKGFDVVFTDADFNPEAQLTQLGQLITQGVDGVALFVVDEGIGPAAVQMLNDADVPVVGETLRLLDSSGNFIAPFVELDGYRVGTLAAEWVLENMDELGLDPNDFASTGFMQVTNTIFINNSFRVDGFKDTFFGAHPGFPESNRFISDVAADAVAVDETESAFNQTSAVLAANPQITQWLLFGAVDAYAHGAIRAIEAAGLANNTIMVSTGGERAIPEWQGATPSPAWKATVYFNALDFAAPISDALLQLHAGTSAEDIFPNDRDPGQDFGVIRISGRVVTPETYAQYWVEGY